MVRRWSYINTVNVFYNPKFDTHRQAAFGATVRATMYFRGEYTVPTSLTRSRWARRKHLNGWLVMSNIVKSWAQVYRFNRNHLKGVLRQHFSSATFIAFNVISVKNSIPYLHKGSESLVVSSFPKKILRYFTKFANPRFRFLLSIKNVNLSLVSLPHSDYDIETYLNNSYSTLLLRDGITAVAQVPTTSKVIQSQSTQVIMSLLQLSANATLFKIKHVYRLLTLVTLLQLNSLS